MSTLDTKEKNLLQLHRNGPQYTSRISGKVIAWAWLFIVVFTVFFLSNYSNPPKGLLSFFFIAFAGSILVVALAHQSISKKMFGNIHLLDAPIYISAQYLQAFVLFGFVVFYMRDDYLLPQLETEDLPDGLFLILFGLISLWTGYLFLQQVRPYAPRQTTREKNSFHLGSRVDLGNPSLALTLVLYTFVILARFILWSQGGVGRAGHSASLGAFDQLFSYISNLSYFVLALTSIQAARGKWPTEPVVIVTAVEILFSLLAGWAGAMVTIYFVIMGTLSFYKRILSSKFLIVSILPVLILPFAVPVGRSMRKSDWNSLDSALKAMSQNITRQTSSPDSAVDFTRDLVLLRQTVIAQTPALILKRTPSEIPYWPMDRLFVIPFRLIPRFLWPSKPVDNMFVYFNRVYLGHEQDESTSSEITLEGYFYLHRGWPTVFVGMALIGILVNIMYRVLVISALQNDQVVLLAIYITLLVQSFPFKIPESIWQGMFQQGLVFYIVARILCTRK